MIKQASHDAEVRRFEHPRRGSPSSTVRRNARHRVRVFRVVPPGFQASRGGQIKHVVVHVIGLILIGLVVGSLGRLFHRGRDRMGVLMTIAIGVSSVLIAGLLVGGFLGFIVAVVVGVVLVGLWSRLVEPRRTPGWRRALRI